MRHKRRGRKLGRNPSHQRALLRNLASALILTERDKELFDSRDPTAPKPPKVPGRIITTLQKAKEVRPLLERCITLARRALPHQEAADELEPNADRDSPQWRAWRESDRWQEWNRTIAPVVAARRRALRLLGDKEAVQILFDEIAPRLSERSGGYTRVLRLAKPRLGDAGTRAILELVGTRDRQRARAPRPSFEREVEESVVREVAPPAEEGGPPDEAEAAVEALPEDQETLSEEAEKSPD
jgi:large subunit ribosomal protein L17